MNRKESINATIFHGGKNNHPIVKCVNHVIKLQSCVTF